MKEIFAGGDRVTPGKNRIGAGSCRNQDPTPGFSSDGLSETSRRVTICVSLCLVAASVNIPGRADAD